MRSAEVSPVMIRAGNIIVEVPDPETALFFLPQCVDPAASLPVGLHFVLGMIVNLVYSTADVLAVLFAALLLGTPGKGRGGLCGSIPVGLGVTLVVRGGPEREGTRRPANGRGAGEGDQSSRLVTSTRW